MNAMHVGSGWTNVHCVDRARMAQATITKGLGIMAAIEDFNKAQQAWRNAINSRATQNDKELLHILEDEFHQKALALILDSSNDPFIKGIAAYALDTLKFEYERYCA